jgi:hypothetical protein
MLRVLDDALPDVVAAVAVAALAVPSALAER